MPIYEFECARGHRLERIFSIVDCPKSIECRTEKSYIEEPACFYPERTEAFLIGLGGSKDNGRAYKVFSVPSPSSIGKPIFIFKNPKTGETRTLYKEEQRFKPPSGFVVEEVNGQSERLRFEKQLNEKQQVENEIVSYQREQMKNATQKNRHDDLNANMSKLDNKSQDLLKAAMARSKKKEFRKKKSEVRIPINHLNKSNLSHG